MLLSPAGNTASTYIKFCFFPLHFLCQKSYNRKNTQSRNGGMLLSFRLEIKEGIKTQVIITPCCSQIMEIICVWGHKCWAKWPFCLFSWKPIKNVIKKAAQQGSPVVDEQLSASEQVCANRQQLLAHSKWKRDEIWGRRRVLLFCIQHYFALLERSEPSWGKHRKQPHTVFSVGALVLSDSAAKDGLFSLLVHDCPAQGSWERKQSDVKVRNYIMIIFFLQLNEECLAKKKKGKKNTITTLENFHIPRWLNHKP